MPKEKQQKIQEFQTDNPDLFIVVASPKDDIIVASFGGFGSLMKFPPIKDVSEGVIFNALRKSKFEEAIEPFLEGLIKGTGLSTEGPGAEVLRDISGAMKGIGESRHLLAVKTLKSNAKTKKGK